MRFANRNNLPNDFGHEAVLGNISLRRGVTVNGLNPDLDTGVYETIWQAGGTFVKQTAAVVVKVFSSSASDVAGSNGAHTVQITGPTSDGIEESETITMNGTSNVLSTKSYYGINQILVLTGQTAGSSIVNAGTITAASNVSSAVMSFMAVGASVSQQCVYTLPTTERGTIRSVRVGSYLNGTAFPLQVIRIYIWRGQVRYTALEHYPLNYVAPIDLTMPIPLEAGDSVELQGVTTANDVQVSGTLGLIIGANR